MGEVPKTLQQHGRSLCSWVWTSEVLLWDQWKNPLEFLPTELACFRCTPSTPVGGTEVFVLTDKHWGNCNIKHTGLLLWGKGHITCCLPRRLRTNGVNILVTFGTICVAGSSSRPLLQAFISQWIYRTHHYRLYKEFQLTNIWSVLSLLFYSFPQESYVCFVVHVWQNELAQYIFTKLYCT